MNLRKETGQVDSTKFLKLGSVFPAFFCCGIASCFNLLKSCGLDSSFSFSSTL